MIRSFERMPFNITPRSHIKMIKILHAAETIKGGVGTVVRQLMESVTTKENVAGRCLVPESEKNMLQSLEGDCISTFADRGRGFVSLFRFTWELVLQVLHFRPDIVHLHSTFAGLAGRTALFFMRPWIRPKVVYCPHAFAFLMPGARYKKWIYAFIERILSHLCDKVICVSHFEMDAAIRAGIPEKKLIVVYNGVSPKKYIQRSFSTPKDHLTQLLFVGRFDYQKGFDLLLEAMRHLEGMPYKLVAAGGGIRDKFLNLPERENIEYVGWLSSDELELYYRSTDFLVFPSRWEGFAMVPLEALSYGLPVLASDCSSNSEIIKDGVSGRLFPSENIPELVKSVLDFSKSKNNLKEEDIVKFVADNFNIESMLEGVDHIYANLLNINPFLLA